MHNAYFIRIISVFQQPPQPPEPFASFAINVLFHHEIHKDFVGPAARHFVCFECFVVKKSVYSVVSKTLYYLKV